jgi:hypothetical protein
MKNILVKAKLLVFSLVIKSSCMFIFLEATPEFILHASGDDLGCFNDNSTTRDLNGLLYTIGAQLTNNLCINYCITNGFSFAGTQYQLKIYFK